MTAREARERIRSHAELGAFISVTEEDGSGPVVGVKDLVDVRGTVTTGGGIVFPDVVAAQDAPVVARVRDHGCTIVGKLNLHEFALGVTSTNPHYGAVLNPHDRARMAGGSSGGSAAAVAAGLCDWAIGTDTGGSVRIPAALCGVVGIRPSMGLVSTEGVLPLAPTQDSVGPLARDVRTAARALEMMAGIDLRLPAQPPAKKDCKLAAVTEWVTGLDLATRETWRRVSAGLPSIALPSRERMARASITVVLYEAARVHERWLADAADLYGSDVRVQLERGLKIGDRAYAAAFSEREHFVEEMERSLAGWDAVLLPTVACVAPLVGQADVLESLVRFTRPLSLTGQPAISIPAPPFGRLPVGLQVIGRRGDDATLAHVALSLEAALGPDRASGI